MSKAEQFMDLVADRVASKIISQMLDVPIPYALTETSLPRPPKVPQIQDESLGQYHPPPTAPDSKHAKPEPERTYKVIHYYAGREVMTEWPDAAAAGERFQAMRNQISKGYVEVLTPSGKVLDSFCL